uniref:Uncharacterized protein n=1 Tax=Labrus bergylta TaxID=56723 RepID=A0A3Q3FGC7_9LABR
MCLKSDPVHTTRRILKQLVCENVKSTNERVTIFRVRSKHFREKSLLVKTLNCSQTFSDSSTLKTTGRVLQEGFEIKRFLQVNFVDVHSSSFQTSKNVEGQIQNQLKCPGRIKSAQSAQAVSDVLPNI